MPSGTYPWLHLSVFILLEHSFPYPTVQGKCYIWSPNVFLSLYNCIFLFILILLSPPNVSPFRSRVREGGKLLWWLLAAQFFSLIRGFHKLSAHVFLFHCHYSTYFSYFKIPNTWHTCIHTVSAYIYWNMFVQYSISCCHPLFVSQWLANCFYLSATLVSKWNGMHRNFLNTF